VRFGIGARPLNSGVSWHCMRHRILVPLLSDPTVLRESDAVAAGNGRFRLVAPQSERLIFKCGEIVECEIQTTPNGPKDLVAVRSISADPEYRKTRHVFATLGAFVGAVLGAAIALFFEISPTSAIIGAAIGAVAFSFCSVRWGDAAWQYLGRALGSL
jgi:hypothetical protein